MTAETVKLSYDPRIEEQLPDGINGVDIEGNVIPLPETDDSSAVDSIGYSLTESQAEEMLAEDRAAETLAADEAEYKRILDEQKKYYDDLDAASDKPGMNYVLARAGMKTDEPVMPERLQYLVERDSIAATPINQVVSNEAAINSARDAALAAAKQARIEADVANGIDTTSSQYLAVARAAEERRNRPASPPRY